MSSRRTRLFVILAAWLILSGRDVNGAEGSAATAALLADFEVQATRPFSAAAGKAVWFKDAGGRSCTTCHTDSVHAQGRHKRTGKVIEPMAPSINPERLTEVKKVNKWFLRNCKWTFGRECSAQEKGDILLWLSQQ